MIRSISFEEAKRRYVHRYTLEHIPAWADKPVGDSPIPKFYAPQYRTDKEWYDKTIFPGEPEWPFRKGETCCYSSGQTWPMGQWLEEPLRDIIGRMTANALKLLQESKNV